jgi:hypothetical protein
MGRTGLQGKDVEDGGMGLQGDWQGLRVTDRD